MLALLTGRRSNTGITEGLRNRLDKAWATSTMSNRAGIWRRFTEFAATRKDSLDRCAAEWVASLPSVLESTRLTYAKHLSAMFGHMRVPCPTTALLCKALTADGAANPTRQATPVKREEVAELLRSLPHDWAMALFVLWKTASRWNDVMRLQRNSFLLVTPEEIVIRWPSWKTNREGEIRASSFTVIRDLMPMNRLVAHLNGLSPTSAIAPGTTDEFRALVQLTHPHLSAHSFKRGAVLYLFTCAANGQLDPWLIPLLAKHQHQHNEFPQTTLRYGDRGDDVGIARMLGTGTATLLL